MSNPDIELLDQIAEFYDDPLGYVMFMFPWDDDPNIQMVELEEPWATRYQSKYGPDRWACELLDELGTEIRKRGFDGRNAVDPIRFSIASGHGIGKSTLVAWLIKFILDTRPNSMGVVTANTGDQLRTKTWAEVAKWHHMSLSSHLWEYSNSRGNMSIYRKGKPEWKDKWRCDALTNKAENSEAFQGLHSANGTPFYIFDEASGIEDSIWEARLGGATDGEPMSFDFGNPTRKSGYFYENTIGKYSDRFITRQIDSRSVKITNKSYIQQLKEDFGEDSDIFKVKVKGQFPSVASVQFIGNEAVKDAQRRIVEPNIVDPVYIGVDVARQGDNLSVIFPRIGMDARGIPYKKFSGIDLVTLVDKIIETIDEIQRMGKKVSGLFIDGGGMGAGPVDMLRRLGYNVVDVNFGKRATDNRFRYWGDQMWGHLRDSLDRMALPNDVDIYTQLTQREYTVMDNGKISLESKNMMKDRGISSPDIADALALTFAQKVSYNYSTGMGTKQLFAKSDYNPLEEKW